MPRKPAPRTVFLTGFPGFLATQLLLRLGRRRPRDRFVLLVEESARDQAPDVLAQLVRQAGEALFERCELVSGDITRTFLGLDPEQHSALRRRVRQVWHLAALSDYSAREDLAHRVNVVGTANVLDFCAACSRLDRLAYVSTCFVSGTRSGLVLESELNCGQRFRNAYESTKFWAEMEVQRRLDELPIVIFRPGIVVGDSRTGETSRYDGVFAVLRLLQRFPSWLPAPTLGEGTSVLNFVPVDYVVDAMAHVADLPDALGKVFQISDEEAWSGRALLEAVIALNGRGRVAGRVPTRPIQALLKGSRLDRLLGVPAELLAYFEHRAVYDTANLRAALADTDLRCPPIGEVLPVLYRYVAEHSRPGAPR